MTDATGPLAGYRATEIAGGVGGAWTGRLLAALGADVARLEPEGGDPLRRRREDPDAPETEGLLHAWLSQGKRSLDAAGLDEAVAASDLAAIGHKDQNQQKGRKGKKQIEYALNKHHGEPCTNGQSLSLCEKRRPHQLPEACRKGVDAEKRHAEDT